MAKKMYLKTPGRSPAATDNDGERRQSLPGIEQLHPEVHPSGAEPADSRISAVEPRKPTEVMKMGWNRNLFGNPLPITESHLKLQRIKLELDLLLLELETFQKESDELSSQIKALGT